MEALAAHHEGIICLSACLGGEVPQHLLHGREAEAKAAALRYQAILEKITIWSCRITEFRSRSA